MLRKRSRHCGGRSSSFASLNSLNTVKTSKTRSGLLLRFHSFILSCFSSLPNNSSFVFICFLGACPNHLLSFKKQRVSVSIPSVPEEACYVQAPLEFREAYLVPPVLKLNSGSNFYCQKVVSHHLWNLTLSFSMP